ncbi:transporter [Mesorhizobium sp. NPDC059025]|uniref:transporter n=1 Tax=unclassified Mesorhizobium TaxID=325217 RepID=UPI0036879128
MLSADEIQSSLNGAWRMMLGKADGLRLLDLSVDGFWNSFVAIAVAAPAMIVGWVGIANTGETAASRFELLLRLAFVDIGTWILPVLALAIIAPRVGLGGRFVHYVVASNWASAIIAWLMLPGALMRLLFPAAEQASGLVSLALFFVSLVFSWRMTNQAIAKGAAMATAVFAGMFATALVALFALQWLVGVSMFVD